MVADLGAGGLPADAPQSAGRPAAVSGAAGSGAGSRSPSAPIGCSTTSTFEVAPGSLTARARAAPAAARPRCCGSSPASTPRTPAPSHSTAAPVARRRPPERRRVGYVSPGGRLFPHLTVAGNIGLRAARRLRRARHRVAELLELVGLDPASPTATRTSSPAASNSGSRWPGPWRRPAGQCCSTSRSAPSTPSCARRTRRAVPRPCAPPGPRPCWSPTTRARRSRRPTRSRC